LLARSLRWSHQIPGRAEVPVTAFTRAGGGGAWRMRPGSPGSSPGCIRSRHQAARRSSKSSTASVFWSPTCGSPSKTSSRAATGRRCDRPSQARRPALPRRRPGGTPHPVRGHRPLGVEDGLVTEGWHVEDFAAALVDWGAVTFTSRPPDVAPPAAETTAGRHPLSAGAQNISSGSPSMAMLLGY
jgi:hypothetical protein